ncbi:DNA topoisomerase VI subunit B [Sedimentisphaera salicampi]|uniref:Type 2 DNA topoisomerase 6 subunit B n=1 Tax=Sedimentisphaera salicampi TaxID=1941349 RepID=A0A1W6LLF1_9BACT|nr:DNA topoisomerase VI subunit B [Sedimentisphaera salicampi]ARN56620.1 DNA topoisomerase VI subunit B [Sedimentisphaera salicampi]OXU15507.1 DNA topoisomerase VI subunit B [Sedimentisphaera salicampi]
MSDKTSNTLLDQPKNRNTASGKKKTGATAETMAGKQRDISISEFFAKNRHLLGFDNPKKALLTTIKEAVDNALDACEEAHILPEIYISIKQITENKYQVVIRDNGPGIVKRQVPNIFARLLYGSKFHSLKMSRGQQGIGISAAGMYGLITTGEPVEVVSRTSSKHHGYYCKLKIDTAKNRPVIVEEGQEEDFPHSTGTAVKIILEGRYNKGRQSVDEYIVQTAMANPHAIITYDSPDGEHYEYQRQSSEMPFIPIEIKPHPYGVEVGMLYQMAQDSKTKKLPEFLNKEFSRVSVNLAKKITKDAGLSLSLKPSKASLPEIDQLHKVVNETKIMAPSTSCIGPIGEERLEEGIRRVVEADFYATCTRKPSVYRGNPFLVEAALAYGFQNGSDKDSSDEDTKQLMQLKRIANRVPLLYQQSAGAIHKAVLDINWRNYALSQSKGALPAGPLILMVHVASVWVPFTSESKEAIAHYPEIIKEIKLAVQECGRKLGVYLRRQKKIKQELAKRSYIKTYLPHIGDALKDILELSDPETEDVVAKLADTLERSRKF